MASKQDVVVVFNMVGAMFPWANMTGETLAVWSEILADIDGETLRAATIAILSEPSQYPPTAGTIRTRALDLAAGPESDWEDAWNAIWQHAKECRAPEFLCTHDLTALLGADGYQALLAVGGYYNLMRTDVSTHTAIRAQFRDIYRSRTARARAAARTPDAVTALLDATRPAQIAEPQRAPVIVSVPTDAGGIRPAPQNWKTETGSRRAELDAIIRRKGGAL